jgi:dynein heavy chain, axonemal
MFDRACGCAQIAVKVLDAAGKLDYEQLDFFLKGNLALTKSARANPNPAWLPEAGWHDLMRLINLGRPGEDASGVAAADGEKVRDAEGSALLGLADAVTADGAAWRAWYELECPEAAPMPGGLDARLSPLERLLVLRCIRMDRVTVRWLCQWTECTALHYAVPFPCP